MIDNEFVYTRVHMYTSVYRMMFAWRYIYSRLTCNGLRHNYVVRTRFLPVHCTSLEEDIIICLKDHCSIASNDELFCDSDQSQLAISIDVH